MAALFETGRIADLLLLVLALEAVGLWWWHRRTGGGVALHRALPFLLAGAAFALALRAALTQSWWGWTALAIAAAGAAHLWDLRSRWTRRRAATGGGG